MFDSIVALELLDYVPPSMPEPPDAAKLFLLEDNDAVLKMIRRGRSAQMRHVGRTHRVNIDWLFEKCSSDRAIRPRYVNTTWQIADLLTKGSFTSATWKNLVSLARIGISAVPSTASPPKGDTSVKTMKSVTENCAPILQKLAPRLTALATSGGSHGMTPRVHSYVAP